ncbi:PAS domain-containing hybrid sensor histidine kinase/response regulator [Aquibium microcysteis]|uniref:PAS domain-containing hybrid sensor histidine kinase/response regulator n=1 Tax=Aquibium microcysteis TaxID=675281 RepID=UPI001EF32EC4|nr:response regulator [Aquibium microcysteis]
MPQAAAGAWPTSTDAAGAAGVFREIEGQFGAHGFATLLELSADWLWETDELHRWSWVSDRGMEVTGLRRADIIGRPAMQGFSRKALDDPRVAAHLALIEQCKPFRDFLMELPAGNPGCRWISVSGVPILDEQGNFRGYRGASRNVTALVEAAARHARDEETQPLPPPSSGAAASGDAETLRAAMNVIQDAVAIYDADNCIVIYNEALLTMYQGVSDVVRPGIHIADFLRAGLERGLFDLEGETPAQWLQTFLRNRASDAPEPMVLRFADGRSILHREYVTVGGGRIGICNDITAARQRENDLARATVAVQGVLGDFKTALDAMNMGVMLLDSELRIESVNRAFRDLWGIDQEAVPLGTPLRTVFGMESVRALYDVPREQQDAYFDERIEGMKTGRIVTGEIHRSNGSILLYSITPLSAGRTFLVHYDITPLKQREAALEIALERAGLVEAALDAVSDPVFVKDTDLRYVFVNEAFARLVGESAESLIGKRSKDVFDVRWALPAEADERRILETGEPLEMEDDPERHGDGRFRILRKQLVTIDGGKRFVSGFLFDITDVRRREQEAEDARRRLAHVLKTLPAGVVIYDDQDRFVLCNEHIVRRLPKIAHLLVPGVHLREVLEAGHAAGYFRFPSEPEMERLYVEDPRGWLDACHRRYHDTKAVREQQNADGTWLQVYDERTSDGYFVGVRVDITELKHREDELRRAEQRAVLADRAKSEFLANMSHEIRTPMNGVLGMAELLARTHLDVKQKTFTDIIVKSGNALLTIINDILDFSKIDAGQLVLDPLPFNLAESVEDVATLMSTRANEKDLELVVRVDPALPPVVVGDVGRLRQIVTNLVGNAVKFTDAGHVLVDVSGTVAEGVASLRFEIEDTGIGIPEDMISQVFEKFSQVDSSSTRRHEGTGLGLAITSRLVALMGGRVGVESRVGEGSTFWFELDLPVGSVVAAPRAAPMDLTGARILVVDDNAVNRSILMEQMAAWGFDACAASSGREALAVLAETARLGFSVDCVVLDYQMPGMNGADVAARIRSTPLIDDTPLIMLTSVDQPLSGKQHRDLGIAMQIIKPVRSNALLEALQAEIQRRRLARGDVAMQPAVAPAEEPAAGQRDVIRLPERAAAAALPDDEPEDDPLGWTSHLDILVAEDNEVNQLVFAQILGETGFTFEIVGNGELALQTWRSQRPSMILMDVSMPQMSGLEATQAIRAEEAEGERIPIVGVTAHALKGDRDRCLEAGMDDYLSKPISPRTLREKIGRWVEHSRQAQAASA